MLPAINLDNKSFGKTNEVDDVTADWYLPPKPVPVKLPATQAKPEFAFGVGHVAPQPPGAVEQNLIADHRSMVSLSDRTFYPLYNQFEPPPTQPSP